MHVRLKRTVGDVVERSAVDSVVKSVEVDAELDEAVGLLLHLDLRGDKEPVGRHVKNFTSLLVSSHRCAVRNSRGEVFQSGRSAVFV